MVDEEALLSVLKIPPEEVDGYNKTGFVILINGQWEPEFLFDSPLPENNFEPVKECILEDVGWMNVRYHRAQIVSSAFMNDSGTWETYMFVLQRSITRSGLEFSCLEAFVIFDCSV